MKHLIQEAIGLLEMDNRPEAESWKERAEQELSTTFLITSVCREDLEGIGFNTQDVDDSTMERLASKMADAYCDNGFWIDLPIIAEYLEIPKHNAEPLKCTHEGCDELQGEDGEFCPKHNK